MFCVQVSLDGDHYVVNGDQYVVSGDQYVVRGDHSVVKKSPEGVGRSCWHAHLHFRLNLNRK